MKLLVVDDDLHIRRLIAIYLRDAGFEVTEAATGEEGLQIAQREPFDRDKLARSVEIALRKRNVEPERIEQTVSKIVQELEALGESEVSHETIGETVMAHLRDLDDVAYVRFASVYRNFREAKDFEAALAELSGDEAAE